MKCQKCNLSIIEEEIKTHQCLKAKGFRIEGDIIWLSDGVTEYPLKKYKINLKSTLRRSTEDETEPLFAIVLYYAQRKFSI